ncbi:uncharacterized protein V6R79_010799 [Siganus canaliculatus]
MCAALLQGQVVTVELRHPVKWSEVKWKNNDVHCEVNCRMTSKCIQVSYSYEERETALVALGHAVGCDAALLSTYPANVYADVSLLHSAL